MSLLRPRPDAHPGRLTPRLRRAHRKLVLLAAFFPAAAPLLHQHDRGAGPGREAPAAAAAGGREPDA
jgi:hypothetical protein